MLNLNEIESQFDFFMKSIGYNRVSEDVGFSPNFDNADYVNKVNKTIVELKILNKDFFENGGVIDSLHSIITKPIAIDENGFGQYSFQIPEINREGKHDNFEEPLRRIIKKANKQLRSTKNYYWESEKSYGFILLAQVGLSSLDAFITSQLVRKILNHEFSSIDGVIICKPFVTNWECTSITNEYDISKKESCIYIADKWVEFYKKSNQTK